MVDYSEHLTVDEIKKEISNYIENKENETPLNFDDEVEKYNKIVDLYNNPEPSLGNLEKVGFIRPLNKIYHNISGHFAILKTIDIFTSAYNLIDENDQDMEKFRSVLDDLKNSRERFFPLDVEKIDIESIPSAKSRYDKELIGYVENIIETEMIDKGVKERVLGILTKISS